jgi:hypothetical protein
MDRSWMYGDRATVSFVDALKAFLDVSQYDMIRKRNKKMCCPCRECGNTQMFSSKGTLQLHLLTKGFMEGYTRWTCHGETDVVVGQGLATDNVEAPRDKTVEEDQSDSESSDEVMQDRENLGAMLHDVEEQVVDSDDEREVEKFARLVEDSTKPLYANCKDEHTRLSVTLQLLKIKAAYNWPDASFDETMAYLADVLPKGNSLPTSTYNAKKVVCPLGLEVQKFHACPKDCIIYLKEYAELQKCPVCNTSRYKGATNQDDDDDEATKGAPAKVVWYLPVLPRLKRLFGNKKEAKLMRWHEEGRTDDGVLRHPADACQWRAIDNEFPEFGQDARNVRFGMSTDGINPFGNMSSRHSTWPVVLWMYNLPPWLCMKRKYIHLSMLIQGPKQPGNDLNVYLEILKDELDTLWEPGAQVWDANEEQYFSLKALLFTGQ